MKILVDADACPVIKLIEEEAKIRGLHVLLICDRNHYMNSVYSELMCVDEGADAADIALINQCQRGDVVVTQDYGVATLALAKGAYCIHQSGKWYSTDTIEQLLLERHLAKKLRRSKGSRHLKGPKKRTEEDNIRFKQSFSRLLDLACS